MKNVLFSSACLDSSGYAEASRNYLCALAQQPDINLAARSTSFEHWPTDIGTVYKKTIQPLFKKQIKPDVQIVHLTPENYRRCIIPGIKNIGYTVWETSKLPNDWVPMINEMDEVWVPCDWNVKVFKDSGVTIPVQKVPHTFDASSFELEEEEDLFNVPDGAYTFYSIFQWSARKNPEGLLKAYYSEFSSKDNVCLVLKTYMKDNSQMDRDALKRVIGEIKQRLWLKDTPPVVLIHDTLSRNQILNLHKAGDCFVLPHRAEGWGIPHFEAMAMGNLAISTNYSGNLEFMDRNNSLLIHSEETPCFGMNRPTYNGHMRWAEPSVVGTMNAMRRAYESHKAGKLPVEEAPEKVLERFSWKAVGNQMRELL